MDKTTENKALVVDQEQKRLFEAMSRGDVRLIAEIIYEKEDTVANLPTIPLSL